ncbi:MAG TPA: hypothetical protein VGI96_10220 [Streptosporangiaceae bacterium]
MPSEEPADATLRDYLKKISQVPGLSIEQEAGLALIQEGNLGLIRTGGPAGGEP